MLALSRHSARATDRCRNKGLLHDNRAILLTNARFVLDIKGHKPSPFKDGVEPEAVPAGYLVYSDGGSLFLLGLGEEEAIRHSGKCHWQA